MDVGSDILLLCELSILTPHFELSIGAKILWILFFMDGIYLAEDRDSWQALCECGDEFRVQ
jgi:hypothetical protein